MAAAKRTEGMLATDDGDARRSAQRNKVVVTGTVGILRLAVEQGLLTEPEANDLLEGLIEMGYFSPIARVFDAPNRKV